MPGKRCDRILIRGVNWIGDAVMTLPALRALRLADPDSRITLLVKPWVSPLFEKDPNVDEIILYSDEYKGLRGRLRLANILRGHGFCEAILFQNAFEAAILTFLAGIPERIGYNRDARGFLLTKAVPFDDHAKGLHHIEYYLNLLNKAGVAFKKTPPWIYLSIDERLQARDTLRDMKRPVVAVNPGAAYGSSKRWRPERFAEVARRVITELTGSVIILGGPSETGLAEEVVGEIRGRKSNPELSTPDSQLLNMSGRANLRELAALISECDVLVTNDSGPMHIGYAVGAPLVAIFGSTSPQLTGPLDKGSIIIRRELDCAPCFARECRKKDLKCMDQITSEEVFDAVIKLVKPKKAVFFDRDGTLCRDANYLSRMEDLEIFPAAADLKRLKENGFSLIGITNQSGIARGLVAEDFVKRVNNIFIEEYGFDGFYYCPHHPEERCSCRKPEPGLLLKARNDFDIELKGSFVVGDKELDMLLAKSVGATGIHVKTGQEVFSPSADFEAGDLKEVADIILGRGCKNEVA